MTPTTDCSRNLNPVPSTRRLGGFAALAAAVLIPSSLFGATATWDDLPNGNYMPTPAGYQGYNWYFGDSSFGSAGPNDGNHGLLQYSTFGGAALSSPNAAYNAWGNTPMRVESLAPTAGNEFTFSGYFSGQSYPGWNASSGAAQLEVEGFIGTSSTPAFTSYLTLPSDGSWVEGSFTGTPVNKLLFSPLDSNGNPSASLDGYFLLDNVQINAVPETGTWTITGMAGCAMWSLIRRRRVN